MTALADWAPYMREAIALAGSSDVVAAGNPRVGCVIVDEAGGVVGRGHHRGAGTPHAEVCALADAGDASRGATAVVTLEPCRHTGRTGPCSRALLDAGIARVVYAVGDPGALSGGGARDLVGAGVEVIDGVLVDEARWVARAWFHSLEHGRPWVTLKSAVSLDGRVADASGGPTAITGARARRYAHEWRSCVDAIVVGTGTVLADDPALTARDEGGALHAHQPLRVVVGTSPLPPDARVRSDEAPTLEFPQRDLAALMSTLHARDIQHVLVEGGPTLAAAMIEAGLVDEILWFVAPVLLGDGPLALRPMTRIVDVEGRRVRVVGEDVVIEAVVKGGSRVHGDR